MFCGGPQRIAEIDQPIKPRDHSRGQRRESIPATGIFRLLSESTKNVARPPISSRSKSHTGARMVERFDHHVFQFFAQKLFDRAFVLFLHLGVIGQQANGAEAACGFAVRRLAVALKSFCTASAV